MRPEARVRDGLAGVLVRLLGPLGLKSLGRAALVTFALRVGSRIIALPTVIVLARTLGVNEYGKYAYGVAWATLLGTPAVLGLDRYLVRAVARYHALEDWGAMRGVLRWSSRTVFVVSVTVCCLAALAGSFFVKSELLTSYRLGLILVPIVSLTLVRQATLQGLRHVEISFVPEQLVFPGLFLVLVAGAAAGGFVHLDAENALVLYIGSAFVAFLVGLLLLRPRLPRQARQTQITLERGAWIRSAVPFTLIGCMTVAGGQGGVVVLGSLATPHDVGIYQVAARIAGFLVFVLAAINAPLAPLASRLETLGGSRELQDVTTRVARASFGFALPLALGVIVFRHQLLHVLGAGFAGGSTVLVTLTIGQLVNASMGPVGVLLLMTGAERIAAVGIGAGIAANLGLTIGLVPVLGAEGAAIGSATGLVTWNTILAVLTMRILGINGTIFRRPSRPGLGRLPRSRVAPIVIPVAGIALPALVAGWLVTSHLGTKAVVAAAVLGVVCIAGRRAGGALVGLALLGIMNGIPIIDLNPREVETPRIAGYLTLALIAALGFARLLARERVDYPYRRALHVASGTLFAWWLVTFSRSVVLEHIPPMKALTFGADFLCFSLLLPLLADFLGRRPEQIRPLLAVLGAGAALYAVGQLVTSLGAVDLTGVPLIGHLDLRWLVHARIEAQEAGTRFYSPMNMLVRAGCALAIGVAALAPRARDRRIASLLTVLFGAAVLVQLTRAAYLGLGGGIVIGAALWYLARGSGGVLFRRALLAAIGVLGLAIVTTSLGGGASLLTTLVQSRVQEGLSELTLQQGTVGYRLALDREMLHLLGGNWPIGLGFLHPAVRYFPGLPAGSIRNSDLGVMNALMTMGATGVVALYLPLLTVARRLLAGARVVEGAPAAMHLGVLMWIVSVVAGSISLTELFSLSGLVLVALILASALAVTASSSGEVAAAAVQAHALKSARRPRRLGPAVALGFVGPPPAPHAEGL